MNPIVVIDDDEDLREMLVLFLEGEGLLVMPFSCPQKALDALLSTNQDFSPSLLIVDYLMPKMTGVELISRFREKACEDLGRVPIFLCTGLGEVDVDWENFPKVTLVPKPTDLEELLELIRQHSL